MGPQSLYVICDSRADAQILAFCDFTFQYLSNGDDGYCLVKGTEADYTVLDCVGDWIADPGSGWDVCGEGSTKDRTLVRKCSVTSGNPNWDVTSAAATCEWEVSTRVSFTFYSIFKLYKSYISKS